MAAHEEPSDRAAREEYYCLAYLGKNFIEASRGEQQLITMLLDAEARLRRVDEFLEALR